MVGRENFVELTNGREGVCARVSVCVAVQDRARRGELGKVVVGRRGGQRGDTGRGTGGQGQGGGGGRRRKQCSTEEEDQSLR